VSEELGRGDRALSLPRFPLSWSHYVRLLSVNKPEARAFYETEALRGGWTVRQLDRQIGTQFYERTLLSRNKAAMLSKGQCDGIEIVFTLDRRDFSIYRTTDGRALRIVPEL
jgi:hypothetical protein